MRKLDATETSTALLSPDEILRRLRAGVSDTHTIKVRDLVVPVRVLSIDEMNKIRRESIVQTTKVQGDDVDKDIFFQKATLAMATTMSGSVPFLGPKVWAELNPDEVHALYAEYVKVMDDVNPAVEQLSAERFQALVEAAKKNTISAKDCSLMQLRAVFSDWSDMIQRQAKAVLQKDS